ncbi:MAG: hypothetical protein LUF81_06925 [Clostridiales bacterium]|nr:hypothetical protein [Clostridiales bacterium]
MLLVLAVAFVCALQLRWLSQRCASRSCQWEPAMVEIWVVAPQETAENG